MATTGIVLSDTLTTDGTYNEDDWSGITVPITTGTLVSDSTYGMAWNSSAISPMTIEDITDKTADMIFEKLKPKIEKLIDDFFGHLILK